MSDKYQAFPPPRSASSWPPTSACHSRRSFERYVAGNPLVDGTVVVGGNGRLVESLPGILNLPRNASTSTAPTTTNATAEEGARFKGLVFDATGITTSAELSAIRCPPARRDRVGQRRARPLGGVAERVERAGGELGDRLGR